MATLSTRIRSLPHLPRTQTSVDRLLGTRDRLRRLVPFAGGALIGLATVALSLPPERPAVIVAGALGTLAILGFAVLAPWDRLARQLQLVLPLLYFGVVALLRHGEGGATSGFGPLGMLPIIWIAVYGSRLQLIVGILAFALMFAVPIVAFGAPEYPPSEWRRLLLAVGIAGVVGATVQELIAQVRRRAADAERQAAQLRRQEAELRRIGEELARSNRELESFASMAAHDLQEPLRKIQAFGGRLRDSVAGLDERSSDYLARMTGASGRMQNLIDDLLSYSRVATRPRQLEAVALTEVVADVLGDLEERVQETGAEVEVGALPTVEADPVQLRQLFQNLVGNALKYRQSDAAPRVTISATDAGGAWHIAVTDNGIGFDPAQAERIFAPFQRLHARGEYEGTGMGLAICQRIVERHGGTIEVESRPGKGSRFTVVLPTVDHEAGA